MLAAAVMAVDGGVVLGVDAAGAQSVHIVGAGTAGCASAYCFSPSQASSNRGDTVTFTNAPSGDAHGDPLHDRRLLGAGPRHGRGHAGLGWQHQPERNLRPYLFQRGDVLLLLIRDNRLNR